MKSTLKKINQITITGCIWVQHFKNDKNLIHCNKFILLLILFEMLLVLTGSALGLKLAQQVLIT
jgi:hypothetical protein